MKTLRIIGSGMKGTLHLTQESLTHCQKANKILWLGAIVGLNTFLNENKWNHEDITLYYENGAIDRDNYDRIKNKIYDELKNYDDIALIVLGHPRLGVTIVQEFQADASIALQILPGISSFDTMINDLKMDPIEEGTCLVDANRLILYDYHMDPCLNYFIYHICSIGNARTDYESPAEKNATHFLQEKLLRHYPDTHELILLKSESHDEKSVQYRGKTGELQILLQHVTFDTSLFIPAMLPQYQKMNMKFYHYLMNT